MDIEALRAFLAVADTRSFSRAAEQAFLTQPAMSKRISALEQELGLRLFDRIGRQVRLTEAGVMLVERARAIINAVEEAKSSLSNPSGAIIGPLRLGTSHHVGLHRLPPALKHFHERYPHVQLDLRFMDSEQACRAVEQAELELAIVTLPANAAPALTLAPVWDDPLEIVVAAHHRLARQARVSLDALLALPAILPGPGTFTREIILQALGSRRDDVRVGMSTNYLEVLRMLVSIGLGWSALPLTLIDSDLKVVHIENVTIHRRLGIVTHAARTLSTAARALVEIVRERE